jgi:hypothetical protein
MVVAGLVVEPWWCAGFEPSISEITSDHWAGPIPSHWYRNIVLQ